MSEHEKHPNQVNPATRTDEDAEAQANDSQGASRDHSASSQHGKQAEQNHDANTEYDPSNGKRRDQLRRNDKRGQMGG